MGVVGVQSQEYFFNDIKGGMRITTYRRKYSNMHKDLIPDTTRHFPLEGPRREEEEEEVQQYAA